MAFDDYRQKIESNSASLSLVEKIAICLVCCNRLAPLYAEFVRREHWGDETPFSKCRIESLNHLRGRCDVLSITDSTLDPLIPSTEEYGTLLGSFAVNSGVAHLHLIGQIALDDPTALCGALMMCYETTDQCVQHKLDPQLTRSVPLPEIESHAMMKHEIEWQFDTLRRVRGNSDLVRFVTNDSDDPSLANFLIETVTHDPNGG